MNRRIQKYYFLLILIFTCYGCKPIVPEENKIHGYSICLGEFTTFNDADVFKSKMDFDLWREMKIVNVETKRFVLLYNNFKTSFEAGQKAFTLYSKSVISNYKIFKEKDYVRDDFANIFFIAKYQGRPSVYNFNLVTKKASLAWSRWGRKVITLNHSYDKSSVFFTTALGFGKKGSFPYVRDARVYYYNGESDQFNEIEELDTGLQLYSYWENKDSFKVNITKPDSIYTDKLIQEIYSYEIQGNKGEVKKRSFSLSKDGFPKPPARIPQYISNKKEKLVREVNENNTTFIYLKDFASNSEEMIFEFKGKVVGINWSDDDKYLFMYSFMNDTKSRDLPYELIVLNTDSKQIIKKPGRSKYPNLLVHGNFIFFDEQSGWQSKVIIYDYISDNIQDEITVPGGCGLNQLPL